MNTGNDTGGAGPSQRAVECGTADRIAQGGETSVARRRQGTRQSLQRSARIDTTDPQDRNRRGRQSARQRENSVRH